MLKVLFWTVLFLAPCYAGLIGLVYGLRLLLPEGHLIYEQIEEYLWAPAGLMALALAGLVAALTGAS